jgi:hypothetical protein
MGAKLGFMIINVNFNNEEKQHSGLFINPNILFCSLFFGEMDSLSNREKMIDCIEEKLGFMIMNEILCNNEDIEIKKTPLSSFHQPKPFILVSIL